VIDNLFYRKIIILFLTTLFLPLQVLAETAHERLDLTKSGIGFSTFKAIKNALILLWTPIECILCPLIISGIWHLAIYTD